MGITYYVDVVSGDDSNAGTSPLAPLQKLSTAIGKSGVKVIYIAPGRYTRQSGFSGAIIASDLAIIKNGIGIVSIDRGQEVTWTVNGTYANVYQCTRSTVHNIVDKSNLDADGDYTELELQSSIADVSAGVNRWYTDGTIDYVRLFDDRTPDADILVLVTDELARFKGNVTVYMEGVELVGGNSGACYINTATTDEYPELYAKDCKFTFSRGNGLSFYGSRAILQNCIASKNKADGFGYHAENSAIPVVVELNCTGRKNGTVDGTANDNGSSIHDAASCVRLSGVYTENIGPNVIDIGLSESWNLGCMMLDSAADVTGVNHGVSIAGSMWLDTCTVTGNITDLVAAAASTLNHRNTTFGTSGGAGTIQGY